MEMGPRALGNRSILADPREGKNIETINRMIKNRDFWMPFAPIILEEYQDQLIKNPKQLESPHMTIAFETIDGKEKIPAGVFLSPSFFFLLNPFFPIEHLKEKSSNLRVSLFFRIIVIS